MNPSMVALRREQCGTCIAGGPQVYVVWTMSARQQQQQERSKRAGDMSLMCYGPKSPREKPSS